MTKDKVIDGLERWSLLYAGVAVLRGAKPILAAMRAIEAVEQSMLHKPFAGATRPIVHPLYWSIDEAELIGGYVRETENCLDVACGILDLIADRVCNDSPLAIGHTGVVNWHLLLNTFGVGVVGPCIAALRDGMATLRREFVRYELHEWPSDDDGESIVGEGEPPLLIASIDSEDSQFEEQGFTTCDSAAEHAVAIWRFDLDKELYAPAIELIDMRGLAAKRMLLGVAGGEG